MSARTARRTSRRPGNGALIAFGLIGMLGVATLVVWRRSVAAREAKVVRQLLEQKRSLMSQKTSLESDLQDFASRAKIVPAAERRLGMHVATELEVRILPPQTAAKDSSP